MFPPDSIILIVDDSSAIRTLIKGQLKSLGLGHVLEATQGKETIEELESQYKKGEMVKV